MESNEGLFTSPDLEAAIDRDPLIVSPDISLIEAIALMGQAKGISCAVKEEDTNSTEVKHRSGCALLDLLHNYNNC